MRERQREQFDAIEGFLIEEGNFEKVATLEDVDKELINLKRKNIKLVKDEDSIDRKI